MILVDSSVWVDYFRGRPTSQTDLLEGLLDSQELAIGDLVFTEVLQGCRFDKEFNEVRRLLGRLDLIMLGGEDIVVEAAKNYRKLRSMGVTIDASPVALLTHNQPLCNRLDLLCHHVPTLLRVHVASQASTPGSRTQFVDRLRWKGGEKVGYRESIAYWAIPRWSTLIREVDGDEGCWLPRFTRFLPRQVAEVIVSYEPDCAQQLLNFASGSRMGQGQEHNYSFTNVLQVAH